MPDKSKQSNETYEFSELGDKKDDIEGIVADALVIQDKSIADLFLLSESDNPFEFLEKKGKTGSLQRALYKDEPQWSQVFTGSGRKQVDLDGWQTGEMLKDMLRDPSKYTDYNNQNVQMIIGTLVEGLKTGQGKSMTKDSLVEMTAFLRDIPDENIYTNVKDDKYEDIPQNREDLIELYRDDSEETIVALDEAPQFLQFADQTFGKSISQAIKMARHNKTHCFYVVHTGKDIPLDIRRQCICVMKTDKKEGVVGFNLRETPSGQMELVEEEFSFVNIPMPNHPTPQQPDLIFPTIEKEDVEKCYVALDDGRRCPNHAVDPHNEPIVCANHGNRIEEAFENKIKERWVGAEEKLQKLKEKYGVKEDEEENREKEEKAIWDMFETSEMEF